MTLTFRPGLTIATVLALGILIALGTWQMQRLQWKRDLIASVEAMSAAPPVPLEEFLARDTRPDYAPVTFSGQIDANRLAPVFGTLGPEPGVYLFAPVYSQADKFLIYVNLGFVPQRAFEAGDYVLPDAATEFTGLFRRAETTAGIAGALRPKTNDDGFWYIRRPASFAEVDGVSAPADRLEFYVDQSLDADDLWPHARTTRLEFPNRHFEYAMTWYGLALTLVGVFIAYSVKREN